MGIFAWETQIVSIVTLLLFARASLAIHFAGGTGEPNDPYQIATAEQLVSIGSDPNLLDKHFVLISDIDLDPNLPGGKVFEEAVIAPRLDKDDPRYPQDTPFSGVLDGGGHVVRNLTIQGGSYLGLFGRNLGTIRNLGVVDARITGSGDNVGALVGHSPGIVTECRCSGVVVGGSRVGGVVGVLMAGRIIRCRSDVEVTALGESAGGLVGYSAASRILMSCSTGSVRGQRYVGGAVGTNEEGNVVHCYATGAVMGSKCVAGLIGFNHRSSSVIQCYSAGLVTSESDVGGLISWNSSAGRTRGVVDGCFWDTESSGQPTSGAGTGRTTAQMHDIETFLAAGWDFVAETVNGASDYWQMPVGDYPQLRGHADDGPVMPAGSGTADDPYLIRDARDLGTVWFEPAAHYRLEASIDLSEIAWAVAVIPWFEGTFDGNGHVISNLHVEGSGYLGLFGECGSGATILSLGLEAVDVNGTSNYVGGLAGDSKGVIVGCDTTGTVAGDGTIGGLVGSNEGNITASHSTSAIVGHRSYVGGLIGYNYGNVATSHSTGAVSGDGYVGGLVGRVDRGGTITDSYSTSAVTGTSTDVGGLVGFNFGSIATSHSTCAVTGNDYVGGLAGENSGGVATSFSDGIVTGHWRVGGLAGSNVGEITASYSSASVTGQKDVGGLVGINSGVPIGPEIPGSITMCYSTGWVHGNESTGGLVGGGHADFVSDCFWDVEGSGQAASLGGTGKTTAQMQTADTFLGAGWDFDSTWTICEGKDYPRLRWEGVSCE